MGDPALAADGAAGDMESLQPTTVNPRTATDRKPANFFMALSFRLLKMSTLTLAAPRFAQPSMAGWPPAARRLSMPTN
jgi:hypothetical protein